MKRAALLLAVVLALSFTLVLAAFPQPVAGAAKTIVVPDDYASIQAAIDSAAKGDTVYVKKGTYHENLQLNKSVSLVGEERDATVIDGNPSEGFRVPLSMRCDGASVSGFTLLYGYAGIQMGANNSVISGNRMANGQHGIILVSGYNNSITGNIFESIGLSSAVQLSYSWNNVVAGNYVVSCTEGIQIWLGSTNNTVTGNTITNCQDHAVRFQYSNNNTVTGNSIANSGCGTSIYVSNWNTITRNNYVNNTFQFSANEDYALTFGYNVSVNTISENYWSDYAGADADGDSLGDVPYVIDENNEDNSPLMGPVEVAEFGSYSPSPSPSPSPVPLTVNPLTLTVLSPENKAYDVGGEIPLTFVVNASILGKLNAGVDYCLDGTGNRAFILGNTSLPSLPEGQHSVTVRAYDEAGNEVSKTVYFTVGAASFPVVPVVASAVGAAVVSVGLLVYFKKRRGEATQT